MHGASGARVQLTDVATKTSDDPAVLGRLRDQYRWLKAQRTGRTVRVIRQVWRGYTMERLQEYGDASNPRRLNEPIRAIWSQPAHVELDTWEHAAYVVSRLQQRLHDDVLVKQCLDLLDYVMSRQEFLTRCLTHGDITRANLLHRYGTPVLIDPIPATPALADIKAFDVSKIVISILGYERIAQEWRDTTRDDREWLSALLLELNYVEIECVRYMSVVQIARLLPYHPQHMWDDFIDIAHQAVHLRP